MDIKTKELLVTFYLEGNDNTKWVAWYSKTSPGAERGEGKTIPEALINLLSRSLDDGSHDETDPHHHWPGAAAIQHPEL